MLKLIKKVRIEEKVRYWDMSIPKTHNYVLGNGAVVHNTGVGFSVQKHHVENLPEITKPNPNRSRRFLIGDSIEGWADAVKVLVKSYFSGGSSIDFDYRDIRQKGARLVTSGGKAPGPQPLKECLIKIEGLLSQKENGDKLKPIEVHDIVCHIADAVLAGGIRRAALISLFSADDDEMISAKTGLWWELNPQRGRANNSAVLLRNMITKEFFLDMWHKIEASGSGEPGIYLSNDKDWGTNPCCEISLRPFQFCNLCEINASDIEDQDDFNRRVKAASFIGTLQASYTQFHYLRPVWQRTTEREGLIGVGMTGIASKAVLELDKEQAAKVVIMENERVAKLIGINAAARCTTIKPSGTSSLVLGTSSGIHAWHNEYYIRRMRVGKNESIYAHLAIHHPELIEDDFFRPHDTAIISVPQRAPEGSIFRTETAIDLLERIKHFNTTWIKPGHRSGQNTHNISATVSIDKTRKYFYKWKHKLELTDDPNGIDEWQVVGNWMWENRRFYNGISVLPYDGGTYIQPPFEDCTKEKYEEMMHHLTKVDLTKVVELEDFTDLRGELACAGGSCTIV